MSKGITDSQLATIGKIIRDWSQDEAFNWNSICAASKKVLGYVPTRQALSKKPILKNAYLVKKEALRNAVTQLTEVPRPQSMLDAMNKIARLQRENDLLKSELAKMAEVAQRFIYNASIAGFSQQKLMEPHPKIRQG